LLTTPRPTLKRRRIREVSLHRHDLGTGLFGTALCLASDEEGEILLADLSGFELSLDGADHYYWLTPEKGRVVLNKQCVPTDQDCDHDVVAVWDEHGQKVFESAPMLDIPNMSHGSIFDSTLSAPDRLIVSTDVRDEALTFVLAEYDVSNEELLRVFPTGPIRCLNLLGDERETVWCLGHDLARRKDHRDYDLVYRFDESGKMLGSSLPRSAFPDTAHPLAKFKRKDGYGGFLPGNGKVRLWLPAVNELITFDSEGRVLDRLILPAVEGQVRARLVTAPDDEIYALLISATGAKDTDTWKQALYRLTDDGATWTPLTDPSVDLPLRITLKGADESGLILLDRRSLKLLWYPIPTDSATEATAEASTSGYDE